MKINFIKFLTFRIAGAQPRAGFNDNLCKKTQTQTMKSKIAIALVIGLLGAVAPPLLQGQVTETYTFTADRLVPDGNPAGLREARSVSSAIGTIGSVKVRLKVDGEFNGDLIGHLRHVQNGATNFCVLLNRPGRASTNSAGYSDSGLDVTFQHGATNGDIHVYRNVLTPPTGSPLTGVWQPDGRSADPTNVTDISVRGTDLGSFAGGNAAGEWTLYLADLESGGTNRLREWALEITGGAYPTLAWSTPANIIYGTALGGSQLNATATYNSTNVPGVFTYSHPPGTVLSAGTNQLLSVTFTPVDSANYLIVTTNVSINVTPAVLTITANNTNKVYGASLPAFTASYSGFVNGDTFASLDTPVTLVTAATASSDVGTYAITASGAADVNYAITNVNGTLTIREAVTAGTIATSSNPAAQGASVMFTMSVSAVALGVGTPSGSVNFRIDGGIAGAGSLSGGVASFSTTALSHGSHTIVAEYPGSVNFIGTTNALTPDQVINSAPIAGGDTIERYPTQGVKVRLTSLLANDSDADSDALNITVSSSSADGGTITVNDGWVFYAPVAGFTNVDSFTYTITDGHGGSAIGTVAVNIKVDTELAQNLTIAAGELPQTTKITGSGIQGRTYRLQFTETINPASWLDLPGGSVTVDSTGVFQFVDTTASPERYYRSVYP